MASSIDALPDPTNVLPSLSDKQLKAILWFFTALTEEINKEGVGKDVRYKIPQHSMEDN